MHRPAHDTTTGPVEPADASRDDFPKSSFFARLKSWFGGSGSRKVIFLVGVLLVVPSISNRLVSDDYLQVVNRISDPPIDGVPHTWVDLFVFGKPGKVNDGFMDRGIFLPWWTYREYRCAFFRPLSALTYAVDSLLWPRSPAMAHVQSIAWYALLLILVMRLYERFISPAWLAGFAFLLFVLDDTHGDPVNWLANRHALIAVVFGLLTFAAHDSNRRGPGGKVAWVVAAVFFSASMLAGETAMATCAFLFSYALFVDSAPWRSRAMSLLPYVLIVVVWRTVYQWLGYGAFGSDGYIDPGREPGAFFARFPMVFAALLQGQLGFIPSEYWILSPPEIGRVILACAFAFLAVFLWLFYSLLRHNRMARFWCVAMMTALVPATAATPGDRTLLFSSIAAAPLLGQLIAAFFDRLSPLIQRGTWRAILAIPITAIALRRLLIGPLLIFFRMSAIDSIAELTDRSADAIPNVAGLAQRSVIVVNPPSIDLASYIVLIRATHGQTVPRRVRWFSSASSDITLTRTSERSLLVRPSRGFLADRGDWLFRASRYPMKSGEKVELGDMTVTVIEPGVDGNPTAAEFTFREPLESASYLWMRWDERQCKLFSLPRVGETVTLPAVDLMKLLQR